MRATLASAIATAGTSLLFASTSVSATAWTITDTFNPSDFESDFTWYTETDPTHGLVLYQSLADAKTANITSVTNDQFIMAVDTTEEALAGRKSVRISSKKSYSDGIYVINAAHVPVGCATWPAFWTVTDTYDEGDWPTGGEIDILENANDQYPSALASLHTKSSCTIPSNTSAQLGTTQYTNCSAYTTSNEGCRVEMDGASTAGWGTSFNSQGGGTYAMERSLGSTGNGIRIWYWAKGSEPTDLASSSTSVDPSGWGKPQADFDVADSCHSDFGPHNIIFDITLCGDWAANTYAASGCSAQYSACSSQVAYNGSSFNESYWAVNSVRVFSTGGGTDNAANSKNTVGGTSSASTSGALKQVMSLEAASIGSLAVAVLSVAAMTLL